MNTWFEHHHVLQKKKKRNIKVSQVVPSHKSDQVDHIRSSDSEIPEKSDKYKYFDG